MITPKKLITFVNQYGTKLVLVIGGPLLGWTVYWVIAKRFFGSNQKWAFWLDSDLFRTEKGRPVPPHIPEESLPAPTNIPEWVGQPKVELSTTTKELARMWELDNAKWAYIRQFKDVPSRWSAQRRWKMEVQKLEELAKLEEERRAKVASLNYIRYQEERKAREAREAQLKALKEEQAQKDDASKPDFLDVEQRPKKEDKGSDTKGKE
jgi:hypothetical protein